MTTSLRRLLVAAIGVAAVLLHQPSSAGSDPVLLTVIDHASGKTVRLTKSDLDGLPQHEISTHTDFTEGLTEFRGPSAREALALAGVTEAAELRMAAVNDYSVTVPFSDLVDYDVVLATEVNGERLSIRNRGPIWLMYPLDQHPELKNSVYNDRLIWQLIRIETH